MGAVTNAAAAKQLTAFVIRKYLSREQAIAQYAGCDHKGIHRRRCKSHYPYLRSLEYAGTDVCGVLCSCTWRKRKCLWREGRIVEVDKVCLGHVAKRMQHEPKKGKEYMVKHGEWWWGVRCCTATKGRGTLRTAQ